MAKHPRDALFGIQELKQRGWTDTAIRDFLPDPDDIRPNPRYARAGAPMRFWLRESVQNIEGGQAFKEWCAGLNKRRSSAERASKTRTRNMIEAAKNAEIKIKRGLSFGDIYELALRTHGGNYRGDPGEFFWSMTKGRNCIRHNLTNYEQLWDLCNRGRTGEQAYQTLREHVDRVIDDAYPEFSDETLWLKAEINRNTKTQGKEDLTTVPATNTG